MNPVLIDKIICFKDHRGVFYESFKSSFLEEEYGIKENFVQDNHSVSIRNTIRGLHYQWNKPMGKLIRVVSGSITDVVVDIREKKSTFGKIYSYDLNEENLHQLYVPPGFAHGFVCNSETAIVLYKCTAEYNKDGESGINPFDPVLNIDWGIPQSSTVISEKDKSAKSLNQYLKEPKF